MLAPLRFTGKKASMGSHQEFSIASQAPFSGGNLTHSPLRSLGKFFTSRVLYSPSALLTRRVLLSTSKGVTHYSKKDNTSFSLLTVNFLKKERLYTKLKYSRSPAYDIVSGGSAALLAGFIGFLIQEKYGFELVDSGDFYYLFMYAVFFAFSFRPLLISIDLKQNFSQLISLRIFRDFYLTVLYLFFYNFKS
tara:strand:- start:167 stop:742 length:576 start_codon:yes stop_codon:yes gene_type:complete